MNHVGWYYKVDISDQSYFHLLIFHHIHIFPLPNSEPIIEEGDVDAEYSHSKDGE